MVLASSKAVSDTGINIAPAAALRSLLISSAALLPLLAGPAWSAPTDGFEPDVLIEDGEISGPAVAILAEDAVSRPEPRAYSASLQDLAEERPTQTLDARRPDIDLRFDLSATDDVEAISVTLSLDPLPGADASLPLIISFNGGAETEIETRGQGFDTTVTLDPRRVRATGNVLNLSYPAPCDRPVGGYRLDLDRSTLSVSAISDERAPQLRDLEKRLASPLFAPRTVGLIASGPEASRAQMLAAQAIALRTPAVPDFRSAEGSSDFDLLMLTRLELAAYTDDIGILLGTGPAVILPADAPHRLILTGDTQEEVLQAVSAFATAFLPDSRLAEATPDDILSQQPLDTDRHIVDATANLDGLSVKTGPSREYMFDVSDPVATDGQLVLRLKRDEQTPSGTRLKATLNGASLGDARVRGRRRTVAYPIPEGLLVGTENRLTLSTQEVPQTPRCDVSEPFIAIASGSELQLQATVETPASDLSRLTANGTVFSHNWGEDTLIILPEDETDFMATLPILARLAEASGRGWTQAQVVRGQTETPLDRHVLIIEPAADIEPAYRQSAPRALQAAWRGLSDDETPSESIQQFASIDAEDTIRLAAQSMDLSAQSEFDGVAAIYPSQSGRLIGVISNTGGASFASALRPLADDDHWNRLSGGVTQWNDEDVMLAQAALPFTATSLAALPLSGVTDVTPEIVDTEPAPGLVTRISAARTRLPKVTLKQPDTGKVGDWIDQRWTEFSQQSGEARTAVAVADATTTSLQQRLEIVQDRGQELNMALQRHLGTPKPRMGSARLGQAQVIPALLLLVLVFLAGLIGMAFAGPRKPRR